MKIHPATGVLLAGLTCWTVLVWYLHRGHAGDVMDDGLYLVAAQSMARGEGNTLPSQVGPSVRSRYPVGVSALVGMALWLAPGESSLERDLAVGRAVILASGWVFFLAAFAWLRRSRIPAGWAAMAVLATAFHPAFVMSSVAIMSDLPYAAVVACLLWRWADPRPRTLATGLFDGLFCGLAMAVRGNGVDLLPGLFLALIRGPGKRRAIAAVVACVVGLVVTGLASRWLVGLGNDGRVVAGGYGGEMTAGLASVQAVAGLLGGHILDVANDLPRVVAPVLDTNTGKAFPRVGRAIGGGILVVILVGAWGLARARSWSSPGRWQDVPAWSYALLTLATFIAWPGWFSLRFLVSMFPMVHLAFARGAELLWRGVGFRRAAARRMGSAALAFALASNLAFTAQLVRKSAAERGLWGDPIQKRDLDATLAYIRSALPPDAVIISMTPELVYLYTGRQGMLLLAEDDRTPGRLRLGRLDRLFEGMDLGPERSYYLLSPPPGSGDSIEARQAEAYAKQKELTVAEVFRSAKGCFWVAKVSRYP
jgi:hypothetical protein